MKPSIFKATLIIERFGGIDGAKRYLQRKGNFLLLSGVTKEVDLEIRALIQAGNQKKDPVKTSQLLDPDTSYFLEIEAEYEKQKTTCSTRTINILQQLEIQSGYTSGFEAKVTFLKEHFFQTYDFSSIRNSGKKTIDEIQNLTKALKRLYKQAKVDYKIIPELQASPALSFEKVNLKTVEEYERLKLNCRARTVHILEQQEKAEGYHTSDSAKIALVERLFFSPVNYKSFKNSGTQTMRELIEIRNNLWKFITPRNPAYPIDEPSELQNALEKHLFLSFPNCQSDILKIGDKFSLQRVFCSFLSKFKFSHKAGTPLHSYLFHKTNLSFKEIAAQTGYTRERVRQVVKKYSDSHLPNLLSSLRTFKECLKIENVVSGNAETFLEIKPILDFSFNGKDFYSNGRRDKDVLAGWLEDKFCFINELPMFKGSQSAVFDMTGHFYFLNKEMAVQARVSELLAYLEKEIYDFESVQFEYNLNVLIRRFYQESRLIVDSFSIDAIIELVGKIKTSEVQFNPSLIRKVEKNRRNDEIKELILDFMEGEQHSKTTQAIFDYLAERHIEINIQQLLFLLGKSTQEFARIGLGRWVLKKRLPQNQIKGSVREIVERLLKDAEKPLHVSEIIDYFKTFRPISERSLRTNLRVSENIHFTFFNCGFIGLKNKNYDAFWFNLPRFDPRKFTIIVENKSLSHTEKINLFEKYSFPRIHCEYLINKRNDKGSL